ncbi:MAG: hypothetical protein AAFU38_13755 [Bacteroidota bacterium]
MTAPYSIPAAKRQPPYAQGHKRKWQWMASLGLVAVGLGASAVADAATRKAAGQPYFTRGTVALAVLNAGLCVFGDAVKHRALFEMKTGR